MMSSLVKSKQIIGEHFSTLFSAIFLSLMFLNIQIDWITLKTYDQQFTLTTKKSLHIIFKARCVSHFDTKTASKKFPVLILKSLSFPELINSLRFPCFQVVSTQ